MRGARGLGWGWAIAGVLVPVLALAPVASPARDLHAYWDDRCKSCHGDSAAFARSTLRVEQGRLAGRHHGADLDAFLRAHYLADDWVAPVMRMLLAQATMDPVFKERCSQCHGSAAAFARRSLAVKDGRLLGNASRQPVAQYLTLHGGLEPQQIPAMVKTLERVRGEVGGD